MTTLCFAARNSSSTTPTDRLVQRFQTRTSGRVYHTRPRRCIHIEAMMKIADGSTSHRPRPLSDGNQPLSRSCASTIPASREWQCHSWQPARMSARISSRPAPRQHARRSMWNKEQLVLAQCLESCKFTRSSVRSKAQLTCHSFAIAFLVYLIGGIAYQRAVMHQRGWRQLPNYGVWAGFFGFIKDMFIALTSSCIRLLPGRRGYSRVNGSVSARGRGSGSQSDDENRLIDQLDEEWED